MAGLNNSPEFLFIDKDATTDDIRNLLEEMTLVGVSDQTAQLFGSLSILSPVDRLSLNITKIVSILREREIKSNDVLNDGLLDVERDALLELDVQGFTDDVRITARCMLNVKERWII
ncbi:MAG TPA: hypothetical protein ENK70_04280, partial [Methylophaga sp.]|nr:hypothetical protein [Methylophaga sp.]